MPGPLVGVRVIDVSNFAPGPMCSMLLADYGADVIAIERPGGGIEANNVASDLSRGKRSMIVDLRREEGVRLVTRLADRADVFLESYRPGVMERRGLGPDRLTASNPGLVYARLTGWGQDGPYANRAGHDINFIGIAGTLGAVSAGAPVAPGAMLGDLAGGALFATIGILLALRERDLSGRGQVVDAAMIDGAALLAFPQFAKLRDGRWSGPSGEMLNGRAPFYGSYQCSCGGWMGVGSVEPKFYASLLEVLGLDAALIDVQHDRSTWDDVREQIRDAFSTRSRTAWEAAFAGADACVTPVLRVEEVLADPHVTARQTLREGPDGGFEPASAPRLSGSARPLPQRPIRGGDAVAILTELGLASDEIDELTSTGVVELPKV